MIISIDNIPSSEEFGRRMYLVGIWTPRNIKWLGHSCPGCARAMERRLIERGWVDLGPQFGLGRLAPIKRIWTYYGSRYDDLIGPNALPKFEICQPEAIDAYDPEGQQYPHTCGDVNVLPDAPYNDPADLDEFYSDYDEEPFDDIDDADWWKG